MILQSSVDWVLSQFRARLGNPYVYGGVYSSNTDQGCDCSGLVGWVLEALTKGPTNMSWAHVVSTESWPYDYSSDTPATPGTVGPYGTISVAHISDIPSSAALIIDIMHGGGGVNSHMNCVLLDGTILESNGSRGSCTNGTGGATPSNSEWTDHWYLPGPIINQEDIVTLYYPDVSNNNWNSHTDVINFLSQLVGEGFSGVAHKVSEGAGYADPYWQDCRVWCEQNGLPCIGYHYVTTEDPDAQAAQWNANQGGPNAMLDFEANSGDIGNFWNVVNAFNAAGVNVAMVYLPHWYWQQIGSPDLSAFGPDQIALVSSAYPDVSSTYPDGDGYASVIYENSGGDAGSGWAPYGGATPTVWQFTDKAAVAGFSVDCNAYLGTADELAKLFGSSVTPPPPPPPPPVTPSSNPPAILKPVDPTSQIGQLWDQILIRWDMLGGRTVVEALAAIGQALKLSGFEPPND